MSTIIDLIARLKGAGVRLTLEEQSLKIHAPKGKLSPELLAELKLEKKAVIAFLQQHAGEGQDLPPIEPVEKKEYYSLSSAQKRLYILWEMLDDLTAYNISYTARIEGNLNAGKLRDAFYRLISVHESLRTSFLMVDGQPVQRVHERIPFELEVFELERPKGQQGHKGQELVDTIIQGFIRPFDLEKAPLLRVCLIKTGEETHILLVDMHHIISDGASMGIIIRNFLSFYNGGEIYPLAVQYKDYAEWQNRPETREANHRMEAFWLDRFQGEIPVLNFPLDFPRPVTQSFAGNTRSFFIGADETTALKNLAIKEEVTPYMLLLAVFYVFLARLCGQEDIVVGTPTAGREFPVIESAVGMFVNTLALRAYPEGEKTFSGFLKEVKETVLESFQNQRYPFEELVDQVVKARDTGRNPLFDVLFTLETRDRQYDREIPGLKLTPYPFENKTAKFDMALTACDTDKEFGFRWEYCTGLFKEESSRRYIVYYLRVLESVAARPGITLAEIDILPEEEREQVLLAFNDSAVDYPGEKLIQEIFAEQVERTPDRIALSGLSDLSDKTVGANNYSPLRYSLSYSGLDQLTSVLAGELIEKGVCPDSIVGLQVGRSIEMIVGALAILKAGGAYLPLDPDLPEARRRYMLADSGAEIVIGSQTVGANNYSPLRDIGAVCRGELPFAPSYLAYVIYTSGSTGQPKGVMVCHRNVIRLVINPNFIDLSADTRLLLTGAPGFDATTFEIWGPLLNGGLLYLVSKEIILDAQRLGSTLKDFQVNTLWLSAPLFNQLLEQDSRIFSPLAWLLVGGDVLSPSHINRVRRENKDLTVVNGYGPTENTTFSACLKINRDYPDRIPIGRPISNSVVFILDARARVQPIGVAGEIWVGGDGVARGYLNNPELTAERFVGADIPIGAGLTQGVGARGNVAERGAAAIPGKQVNAPLGRVPILSSALNLQRLRMLNRIAENPQFVKPQAKLSTVLAGSEGDWCVSPAPDIRLYKTGDRGRWLDDGNIEFLGRQDDQVKIRGFRIEPGEIEAQLVRHPGVKEAVVSVRQGDTGDKALCAYLVPDIPGKETDALETEVRDFLSGSLPDYMIPAHFVFLKQFPLTANGKIDRKALPEPEIKAGTRYTAPRTHFERRLVKLFTEVLRRDAGNALPPIGLDDDFFALGGHSLKATTLTYRLREEFSVTIRIGDIFSLRTIRALAQKIMGLDSYDYQAITPVEEQEYYDLSYAQRRLWVLCQFEEDSSAYNIPGALLVKGGLDLAALKRAFQSLVNRHESLRTSFVMIDGQPRQKVWTGLEVDVPVFDLRQLDEEEKEAKGREINRQTANHIFNLEKAPLTILRVLRLEEEKTILTWNTHHIVDDGWSEGNIANDFIRFYNAYSQGLENPLPALTLQYKDYTHWHNNLIARDRFSAERQYWLEKFKDRPNGIELPLDFPRQTIQTFNGGRIHFVLQPEQTRGLRELSARCDGTLFMGLLTLLSVFLYRYSGQRDILLGAPIANRKQVELQPLVGFFVNTLVYRVSVDPEKSFLAQLAEVKEEALRCYEYQDYPFDLLVEELGLERDLSQSPLFNVMIAHNNAGTGDEALTMHGLTPQPYPYADDVNMSKFDLIFFMDERGEDVAIRIEYNSDLFRQERIGRMVGHFLELLGQVLSHSQAPVRSLGLLAEPEYRQVVQVFNDNRVDFPPVTIQEMFEAQVERTPGKVAVVGDTLPGVSYRELNGRANRLAHYLRLEHGIKRNDIIGVSMERSIDMIVVLLGIVKSGAAYLAVDPTYPRERVLHVLQDSQTALLIIDKMREELFGGYTGTIIDIHDRATAIAEQPKDNPQPANQPTDILYVNYTSGSTGTPNGAMLSHDCLTNLIQWQNEKSGVDCSLKVLQFTSINFCVSFQEIMGTLTGGGELHLIGDIERQEIDYLMDFLAAHAIEVLFLPFSYLNFLFNETSRWDKDFQHSLQHIITAGEQLKVTAGLKRFLDNNPHIKLHNHYGSTEMHVVTSYTLDASTAAKTPIPPAGKPIDNVRIFILDENLQVVPLGVWGELCVEGREEILGYINNRELTEKKLIRQESLSGKRLYRSGDIGRWLADGNIELRGRKDFMVKVRGFRVELGEIESRVLGVKGVRECVVVVKEDGKGVKNLVAYVSLDGVEVAEVRRAIRGVLPQYMLPRFVVLEGLPLMPNGKVDREKLPEPQPEEEGIKVIQPRDEIEQRLSSIWGELLGVESGQIGIDDNFFEKGGHSLKAVQMVSRIYKHLHCRVQLTDVFKDPTIRAIGELARRAEKVDYRAIREVEKKEYYISSSAQRRLFILQQLDVMNTAYNMPAVFWLNGRLDQGNLKEAFRCLIERHESLRTSFTLVDGEPVQRIHEQFAFELEVFRAGGRGGPCGRSGQELIEHIIQEFIRPFDLAAAPLIRVGLIKTGEEEHILMIDMHHIICDGTSLGIMIREFLQLYCGQELPPLKIQYKDFTVFENRVDRQSVWAARESFWLERFAGEIPTLQLPTDYPRPKIQGFSGDSVRFDFSTRQTGELYALANRYQGTLYMTLLALYYVLLFRLSGQEDIVIGTPVAGRTNSDVQDTIGMFVNTLALRHYPKFDLAFEEFLAQVTSMTIEAFDNQDYHLEDLVEKVSVNRDTSRNPLFDVMFVLQNVEIPEIRIPGLTLSDYPFNTGISKFDMTMAAIESDRKLIISIEYGTKLFTQQTIERWAGYFQNLAESVCKNPEQKLADIDMIPLEEKQRLLFEFNDSRAEYPEQKTIPGWFSDQVNRSPDRIALSGETVGANNYSPHHYSLSYSELNRRAESLAGELMEKGVCPNTIVALQIERSIDMIVGILGILKAGGAYLPLDPEAPEERVQYMLQDSGAEIVIGSQAVGAVLTHQSPSLPAKTVLSFACGFTNCGLSAIRFSMRSLCKFKAEDRIGTRPKGAFTCFPGIAAAPRSTTSPLPSVGEGLGVRGGRPTDLAYVIYTSGSTGQPKGTLISHQNVIRVVKNTNYIDITEKDRLLQLSNYAFDGSVFDIYGALLNGSILVLIKKEELLSLERLSSLILIQQITVFFVTTALFNTLVDFDLSALAGVRKILFGGEQVSVGHVKKALAVLGKGRVMHVYGPTETTVYATFYPVEGIEAEARTIPIGWPLTNTGIYILDGGMRPLPLGVKGEIYIGGEGLSRGYLNNPELTAERFVDVGARLTHQSPSLPAKTVLSFACGFTNCGLSAIRFSMPVPGIAAAPRTPATTHQSPLTNHLYKTGDLGRWLANGTIEFLGRIDFQVKIRGFRIELGEIEAQLVKYPLVKEAVVSALGEGNEKYLCAYVKIEPDQIIDIQAVREFLSKSLPDYMVPAHFVCLEKFPLNPSGKVDRKALPEPGLNAGPGIDETPQTPIELALAELWAGVLNVPNDRIGVSSSFFDLGGHSLKAAVLVAHIRHRFDVEVPLVEVFKTPLLKGMARLIARAKKSGGSRIEAVEDKEYYELSYNQKRLWIIHQLDPASPAFHMPGHIMLAGPVAVETVEKVLFELARRHESFRTSFNLVGAEPVQRIEKETAVTVAAVDLSGLSDEERDKRRQELFAEVCIKPFDLGRAPLFRAVLVRLSEDQAELQYNLHHIIADGWSLEVLRLDFTRLYEAFQQGTEAKLDRLAIQYRDFAAWQNRIIGDEQRKEEAQAFWRPRLMTGGWELGRLCDFPARRQDNSGAGYRYFIKKEVLERLKGVVNTCRTSLFVVVFSAYILMFSRYSGQLEVGCSIISAGREDVDLHRLMGFFVNSLLFKIKVDRGDTFAEFVQRVHDEVMESLSYQGYPIELVLEEMGQRHPDVGVSFNMINLQEIGESTEGQGDEAYHIPETLAVKFDIELYAVEYENGLELHWRYKRGAFLKETIEHIVKRYARMLDFFSLDAGKFIQDYSDGDRVRKTFDLSRLG